MGPSVHAVAALVVVRDKDVAQVFQNPNGTEAAAAAAVPTPLSLAAVPRRGVGRGCRAMGDTSTEVRYEPTSASEWTMLSF
jgi:hypothetical protein